MSFSENLRDILDFRGMQTKELAAKTEISKNTIDNYLSGQKSLPNIENGVKIAQALGVTVEYLVTGNTPTTVQNQPLIHEQPRKSLTIDKKLSAFLDDLKRLKKSDFDSIRAIVKSLAIRTN